jgi:hypothetical protein
MACLLIFLSGFISSYFYLTDPARIKAMSQSYLSGLVGGHVEIGAGSLTVFEGLKLSHVTVTVDDSKAPDATLFYAENIEIQYDPASLLRGRLEATRIIATGAKVKLVEEAAQGHWNYQRLIHPAGKPAVTQPAPREMAPLPELVLRDAQLEYSEMQGKAFVPRGSMAIEGRLFPSVAGSLYQFELQSRGAIEGVGPVVSGFVTLKTGEVNATLSHLRFGPDVEAMLPREVRDFWTAHEFEGALDIPDFSYTPASANERVKFRLRTQLSGVHMIVRSEEFTEPPIADIQPSPVFKNLPPLAHIDQTARRMVAWLHPLPQRPPIAVDDVTGGFLFDQNGIRFDKISGTIAGATLMASGKIDGYSPDAPIWVRVENKPGQLIEIPENPDFLPSLPSQIHQAYTMLKPHGTGAVWAELNRALPNGLPQITGEINIVDGCFQSIFFPYPIHGANGKIRFSPDPTRTFERIELQDIHGHGAIGGPNELADLRLSGWAGDNPDAGCRIRARAKHVMSEPAVFAALPPPVRKVMTIFQGPGIEKYPHFAGDFDCTVVVPPGVEMRPIVSIDLNFTDGSGKLTAFAYPLENMTGQLAIRDGYLDTANLQFKHANTTMALSGHVSWPTDLPPGADVIAKPNLQLTVRNLPIDHDLIDVLPPQARAWLHTVGAGGTLDVDGRILANTVYKTPADSIGFDLSTTLRNGSAHPPRSDFAITDATGQLRIHPDRMEVLDLRGKRGDGDLAGAGSVDWSTGRPVIKINSSAHALKLDPALCQLLPAQAQQAWTQLDPHGLINAQLFYQGSCPAPPGEPIASLELPNDAIVVTPLATPEDFKITIEPTDVTVTAKPLPYRLDHCVGKVTVTPQQTIIESFHGVHGKAAVDLAGQGLTTNPNDWDLALHAANLPVDPVLLKALPLPVRQVLSELKYKGNLSVDLKTFRYRGDRPDPDIDLSGTLTAIGGSVDVGVPIEKMDGSVSFDAAVRGGKLAAFRGQAAFGQMSLVDRPVSDLKAELNMPTGSDVLTLSSIHGEMAGGEVAGHMDLKFPDVGPSSYLLDFEVKNADLRETSKEVAKKGQDIRGLVSASVALQGEWADPSTRRGRGDVLVTGKELYQIPLLLGILEVTNLALPTSSPFNEGTARYLVEGNRVTFEQVQMRSNTMVMSGNGWLDFGSKLVRMNFTTENPNLPKLPIVDDLWEGAKNELLQIQVRGTVQSPKVSAAGLHTLTTTVDEVFSGSEKEK